MENGIHFLRLFQATKDGAEEFDEME